MMIIAKEFWINQLIIATTISISTGLLDYYEILPFSFSGAIMIASIMTFLNIGFSVWKGLRTIQQIEEQDSFI